MFIKLGLNMQSKDEIELAVFKTFREFLLAVLLLVHSVSYGKDSANVTHVNTITQINELNWRG